MDGEADASELKHTLDSLQSSDEELKGAWLRYHTYSAILRGEVTSAVRRNQKWDELVANFKGDINEGVPQPRILPFRSSYKNVVRNRWLTGVTSAMAASLAITLSWLVYIEHWGPASESSDSPQVANAQSSALDGDRSQQGISPQRIAGFDTENSQNPDTQVERFVRRLPYEVADQFDLQTVRYRLSRQDMQNLDRYLQLYSPDTLRPNPPQRNSMHTVSSPNSR